MTDMVPSQRYELTDRYRRDEGRVFMSGSRRSRGCRSSSCGPTGGPARHGGLRLRLPGLAARRLRPRRRLGGRLGVTTATGSSSSRGSTRSSRRPRSWGSQLAATIDGFRHDGVIGFWYGKAPGLDRASDAIRHAVFAGAIARAGWCCSSATTRRRSRPPCRARPRHPRRPRTSRFHPGDVQEALDLGRHAVALSRASGLWTSMKVVAAVADGSGTVDLHADRITSIGPEVLVDGRPFVPHPSGKLLTPYTLDTGARASRRCDSTSPAATASQRPEHDPVGPSDAWIGIVATGHTYRELLEALRLLGLRHDRAHRRRRHPPAQAGACPSRSIATSSASSPVDSTRSSSSRTRARPSRWLVKDALYASPSAPVVVGKHDERRRADPAHRRARRLTPSQTLLRRRLVQRSLSREPGAARSHLANGGAKLIPLAISRTPYFCSGCPHNTSTKVARATRSSAAASAATRWWC